MGKASRRKNFTRANYADNRGIPKSSKNGISPKMKEELRKSSTKTISWLVLPIVIILVTSFTIYCNSLFNGFVYDDEFQVLGNRWITDIRYIPEIFSKNVWSFSKDIGFSNYYRPMMHLMYMIDYHTFGLKPWGFHLMNILFHSGVSLLVFGLTLEILRKCQTTSPNVYLPSFIAAIFFAVHPVHTEAVTWVAGLPDVLTTFFYLLSLYLYIKAGEGLKVGYFFSLLTFFIAILCKETALTLPIILIAFDYAFERREMRFSGYLKRYMLYFFLAGIYLILRSNALGGIIPTKYDSQTNYRGLSIYQFFINVFPLFNEYLEKLLLPINLNFWHTFHPIKGLFTGKGMVSLVVTILYASVTLIAMRRNKGAFFGLLLIFVPLLPAFYIPGISGKPFAERYLYLPSVGLALIIALLVNWTKVNRPATVSILVAVCLMIVGLYSVETLSRNTIWRDDITLYGDTVKKSPDSDLPHFNFGVKLREKGKIDEAIEQYQIALKMNPDYLDAHVNLGNIFLDDKGWIDKAIEQYQIAIKLNPNDVDARNNLGNAFLSKGWTDKAVEQYQIALKLNPDKVEARYNLGNTLLYKGWIDKAIEQYQIAIRLNPNYADVHINLGNAYLNKGLVDKAIEEYQIAIRINPSNSSYRSYLTKAHELKKISR